MSDVGDTRFARTANGSAIAYRAAGAGPPDIVLLGNPPCVDVLWEDPAYAHLSRRLSRLGRLISFDYRGTGSSDPIPFGEMPTPEDWVEDIEVILDEVESSAAVIIGQGSAAGSWAMLFAAVHPQRVSHLVVVDGCARLAQAADYQIGVPTEVLSEGARYMADQWGTGAPAALFAPSRAADPAFRKWHARFERLVLPPAHAARVFDWMNGIDVRAALATISVPTLLVQFESSPWLQYGHYLAESIPAAEIVTVPGAGENIQFCASDGDQVVDAVEIALAVPTRSHEPDRALASVLFTDMVSSTNKAVEVGDRRWKEMLDEHDALTALEVERHRGRLITTTGDGILAIFDGPGRAIRCAQAIQSSLRPLGMDVRAGIHAGEIELRESNVGGIAVHIAARICARAGQGECLVSSTVKDLVIGSGIDFVDAGEHELKGVPGKWQIFAVSP